MYGNLFNKGVPETLEPAQLFKPYSHILQLQAKPYHPPFRATEQFSSLALRPDGQTGGLIPAFPIHRTSRSATTEPLGPLSYQIQGPSKEKAATEPDCSHPFPSGKTKLSRQGLPHREENLSFCSL